MSNLIPTFRFRDAPAAIDFLGAAFGFERHAVHEGGGGAIAHAELRLGDDFIMLGSLPAEGGAERSFDLGAGGGSVYVVVDGDVDPRHARAVAAGAETVLAPRDTDYGSREFTVRDPEGNLWSVGTYRP